MDEAQKIEQESINVSNDNKPKPQKLSLYEISSREAPQRSRLRKSYISGRFISKVPAAVKI